MFNRQARVTMPRPSIASAPYLVSMASFPEGKISDQAFSKDCLGGLILVQEY